MFYHNISRLKWSLDNSSLYLWEYILSETQVTPHRMHTARKFIRSLHKNVPDMLKWTDHHKRVTKELYAKDWTMPANKTLEHKAWVHFHLTYTCKELVVLVILPITAYKKIYESMVYALREWMFIATNVLARLVSEMWGRSLSRWCIDPMTGSRFGPGNFLIGSVMTVLM